MILLKTTANPTTLLTTTSMTTPRGVSFLPQMTSTSLTASGALKPRKSDAPLRQKYLPTKNSVRVKLKSSTNLARTKKNFLASSVLPLPHHRPSVSGNYVNVGEVVLKCSRKPEKAIVDLNLNESESQKLNPASGRNSGSDPRVT